MCDVVMRTQETHSVSIFAANAGFSFSSRQFCEWKISERKKMQRYGFDDKASVCGFYGRVHYNSPKEYLVDGGDNKN